MVCVVLRKQPYINRGAAPEVADCHSFKLYVAPPRYQCKHNNIKGMGNEI